MELVCRVGRKDKNPEARKLVKVLGGNDKNVKLGPGISLAGGRWLSPRFLVVR